MLRLGLILGLLFSLTACAKRGAAAASDCLFTGGVTATPLVQQPTATPDLLATPTLEPTTPFGGQAGTPCPTYTPTETPTAVPTATRGAWLGQASGQLHRTVLTLSDEELLGVSLGYNGLGLAWWRTEDGQVVVAEAASDYTTATRYALGAADEAVVLSGPAGVAALLRRSRQVTWRLADQLDSLPTAPDHLIPWAGDDLAAGYGPEGWLYVASAGQLARYNPFSEVWEFDGNYGGAARSTQITSLASGAMLLLTDTGLYRRDGDWRLVWNTDAIQVPRNPDSREAPRSVAAKDDHLALAWVVAQGWGLDANGQLSGNFDLTEWRVTESADGGLTWSTPETVAYPATAEDFNGNNTGWYGDCAALYRADGTLEVAGLYAEVGRWQSEPSLSYPVVARREGGGWFPELRTAQPESLIAAGDVQPARNFLAASLNGQTLLAWEAQGFNGKHDIETLSR